MAWAPGPDIDTLDDAFYDIMTKITHSTWNRFARSALRLDQNEIDELRTTNSRDAKEMKFRMCKKWQESVGSAATVETAYGVLNHFLFPKKCLKPDFSIKQVSKMHQSGNPKAFAHDALPFVDDPPIADYCNAVERIDVLPSSRQFYNEMKRQTGSTYPLKKKKGKTGCVFILNNMFHHLRESVGDRRGSEKDLENMEKLWKQMGCEVVVQKDLSAGDLKKELLNFSDHCDGYDYCVLFFMSHGNCHEGREVILGNDNGFIYMDEIYEMFNNVQSKHLQEKPKLFFFQCCRGDVPDSGVTTGPEVSQISFSRADGPNMPDSGPILRALPSASDMLMAHATQFGFQAFRNVDKGSWFVNAIANVFMRHAKTEHVADLMTKVHDAVSTQTTDPAGGSMAMPEAKTTLRRKLYLYPGI